MLLLGAEVAGAATIAVSTSADEVVMTNGNCTLREALAAADANVAVDACPAGSPTEPDVILLLDTSHAWSVTFGFVGGGGPVVLRGPDPPGKGCYIIINAASAQRFLRLLNGADLTIENVEIREGDASGDPNVPLGGAIAVDDLTDVKLTLRTVRFALNRARSGGALFFETASGCSGCSLTIERSTFEQNTAEYHGGLATVSGGAAFLQLRGDTTVRIVDTVFQWNEARSNVAGSSPQAGALYAGLSDTASLEIRRSGISSNSAIAGVGASAANGGASVWPFGSSTLVMEDVWFAGNQLVGPGAGVWPATALEINTGFSGTFALDRLDFYGNDWSEDGVDLRILHISPSPASAHNVLLAAGARRGADVANLSTGSIALSHWTVTQHVERGLWLQRDTGTGELRVDNSIVWQNGVELVTAGTPSVDPDTNLIGVDPMFEAPSLGGFRLHPLSPAIGVGDPARSGGPYDLGHRPRVVGAAPDAGAFEHGGLFGDGFESGDTGAWSATIAGAS
jgi:hypothetical protein